MPSRTPQHLGVLVEVVVIQLVHDAELDHMLDLGIVVEVLELLELLLIDLPLVLLKDEVLGGKLSICSNVS
eukprot:12191467-Prorocentrum_lima.AAC.1